VISEHRPFKLPSNPDIKVWRYVDLERFLSLIITRCLYFSRGDRLGDPFEGSIRNVWYETIDRIPSLRQSDLRFVGWRALSDSYLLELAKDKEKIPKMFASYFVNCWHMNERESAASWQLYSRTKKSLCIQSTYKQLAEALPSEVLAGVINYVDYGSDRVPMLNPYNVLLYKPSSFAYERELRVALLHAYRGPSELEQCLPLSDGRRPGRVVLRKRESDKATDTGFLVPIDLPRLADAIYVSPTSPMSLRATVESVVASHGLEIPVRQSST
jgi:hypothetical protein